MEVIGLAVFVPLLILVVAFSLITASFLGIWYIFLAVAVFVIVASNIKYAHTISSDNQNYLEQLETVRRVVVTFSIAILLPVFARYLMDSYDAAQAPLIGVLIALALGYAAGLWGVFTRHNKVLSYANVLGGAAVLVYAYFHLWDLGSLPRVIATAFGLVVAVVIAIVKFKEKLK